MGILTEEMKRVVTDIQLWRLMHENPVALHAVG